VSWREVTLDAFQETWRLEDLIAYMRELGPGDRRDRFVARRTAEGNREIEYAEQYALGCEAFEASEATRR
jgi:hypothetical protein